MNTWYQLQWPIRRLIHSGDGTFELVVLPEKHYRGWYEIKRMITRRVAAISGTLVVQNAWTDPDNGGQTLTSPSLPLNAAGQLPMASNILAFSSGEAPLIFSGAMAGVTGSPVLDIMCGAFYIGDTD